MPSPPCLSGASVAEEVPGRASFRCRGFDFHESLAVQGDSRRTAAVDPAAVAAADAAAIDAAAADAEAQTTLLQPMPPQLTLLQLMLLRS